MARAQRTPSDSGSEIMEGQSGSKDQREEYFGEAGAPPVRRSERLLQKATPKGGYIYTNLPPPYIEAMWVKVQREIPMRVWFVKQQNVCAYYGADGTKKDITQEEMSSLELPHAYVKKALGSCYTRIPMSLSSYFKEVGGSSSFVTSSQ